MIKFIRYAMGALMIVATSAVAGPDDPSAFDPVGYPGHKALYDFNFDRPAQGKIALKFIKNHLRAIKEFGDPQNSKIVVVAHGDELHAFSRLNRAAFPEMYDIMKGLADQGVEFHVCRNAARARGYKATDFYDVATVVPAAVIDIAHLQNQGYSYMYAEWFPMEKREVLMKEHPELDL
ncbi:MAG: DsrE family protein [Pseudomonadota bacterium]